MGGSEDGRGDRKMRGTIGRLFRPEPHCPHLDADRCRKDDPLVRLHSPEATCTTTGAAKNGCVPVEH